LDDGYEARLLTMEQIKESLPAFAQLFSEVQRLYPDAPKKLQFNEVLRRILDRWVSDLIQNTKSQIEALSGPCGSGRPRPERTLADIRLWPKRLVCLSPKIEAERRQTKQFLYENLYYSPVLEPEKRDAERIINELFDLWMAHPEKLP